jgi:GAF domain-containing protein
VADFPDDLLESLVALTELMANDESLVGTLERVAGIACRAVPSCESAGVTLAQDGLPITPAFSGAAAPAIDQAQYDDGVGPCLLAYRERRVVVCPDTFDVAEEWPAFAQAAADHGIRSSLSLPLVLRDRGLGALNLYASTPGAFDQDMIELGRLFGAQAAVAISNAELLSHTRRLTENLQTALESRDIIGQAKGILMNERKLTADEAFDLLRRTSQRLNIKLREIADRVVLTGELREWNR